MKHIFAALGHKSYKTMIVAGQFMTVLLAVFMMSGGLASASCAGYTQDCNGDGITYPKPGYHVGFFSGNLDTGVGGYSQVVDGGIPGASSMTKSSFASWVSGVHSSGIDNQGGNGYAVGADFIINITIGKNNGYGAATARPTAADVTDFMNRINNPAVTMSYVTTYTNDNGTGNGLDSGYKGGDIAWTDQVQGGPVLEFFVGGVLKLTIRTVCGNPLGQVGPLPVYAPAAKLNGYLVTNGGGGLAGAGESVHVKNRAGNVAISTANGSYDFGVGFNAALADTGGASSPNVVLNNVRAGYTVVGSTYCVSAGACNPGNDSSGSNFAPGATRYVPFVGGQIYSLRWILQPPAVDRPPAGSVTVSCNANGTGRIVSSYSDPDGPTTATIRFQNGSINVLENAAPGAYNPWTVAANDADTAWTATLVVQDVGGNADLTVVKSSGSCNVAPNSSVTGATCNADLKGYAYDPNNAATKLNVYVYVNPPGAPPASYASRAAAPPINPNGFRGPAIANAAPPTGSPAAAAGHGFTINTPVTPYNYNGDWSANTYALYAEDAQTGALYRINPVITQPSCSSVAIDCSMTNFGSMTVGDNNPFYVQAKITGSTTPPPVNNNFDITIMARMAQCTTTLPVVRPVVRQRGGR